MQIVIFCGLTGEILQLYIVRRKSALQKSLKLISFNHIMYRILSSH